MARNNYSFEKRQRELAKKKKREEKRQQKSEARQSSAVLDGAQETQPEQDVTVVTRNIDADGS